LLQTGVGFAQTAQTPPPTTTPNASREITTRPAVPAEPLTLSVQNGVIPLSLEQAIEIALQQNLGLIVQRYLRAQERLAITQELGIYDLNTNATLTTLSQENATLNQLEAASFEVTSLDAGFEQLFPTGGNLTLGWENNRVEQAQFRETPVSYNSNLSFNFVQPLLRNFGRLVTESNILIARTNSQISREEFERQATLTVQEVVNAYWALAGAREQETVAQESLALARELHERNRIQVDVGTLPPLELVQSEATIAVRDEDIIRTQAVVGDRADDLRRLLNLPEGELWTAPIEPTTPPEIEPVPVDVDQAILTAYAERPELRNQELAIENARINALVAQSLQRPQLNLVLDYGFDAEAAAYSDAFNQISGVDFTSWTIQLLFNYPIQNRTARARSAIANLALERGRIELDEQRTVISTEVRRAARGVDTAAKQIEASRISREFQEKNLDAERKRYENGMSTSFQITQIQEELTRARSREVESVINYRTALAEFYRTTGRLLDVEGVAINDPTTKVEDDGPIDWWDFSVDPLVREFSGRERIQ
jgi:outer membrane protein TolC